MLLRENQNRCMKYRRKSFQHTFTISIVYFLIKHCRAQVEDGWMASPNSMDHRFAVKSGLVMDRRPKMCSRFLSYDDALRLTELNSTALYRKNRSSTSHVDQKIS